MSLVATSTARADDDRTNRIVFGYGQYGFYKSTDESRHSFHLEARMAEIPVWKFHPWVGVEYNEAGSNAAYAGLETDMDINENWVVTLQAGAGYFNDGKHNRNRDYYPPEGFKIRTQAEIGYKFENGYQLSFGASHSSNAGTKFPNPGGNMLSINAHVPIGNISGD
ncbi:MAG: acyloxyacyl hydrolase [Alphaproteobacteria bacterium]|nr:acyloxyacyl hydrolase [Alphaproteobacteria bacterium]